MISNRISTTAINMGTALMMMMTMILDSRTTTTTTMAFQFVPSARHNAKSLNACRSSNYRHSSWVLYSTSSSSSSSSSHYTGKEDENDNNNNNNGDTDNDDDWVSVDVSEVIETLDDDGDYYGDDTEEDWIPDRVKAQERKEITDRLVFERQQEIERERQIRRQQQQEQQQRQASSETESMDHSVSSSSRSNSPYTDEEEELIEAMGGKQRPPQKTNSDDENEKKKRRRPKREPGFIGDSTLEELSLDYSVPICYLADVLVMWGYPVPINVQMRLGDIVTGEQAFAILEAINSLDIAALQDRYSNMNLLTLCGEFNIPIEEAFGMAMKEGWSLPFGIQTNLRVEQEEELLRVMYYNRYYPDDDDDDDDDDDENLFGTNDEISRKADFSRSRR